MMIDTKVVAQYMLHKHSTAFYIWNDGTGITQIECQHNLTKQQVNRKTRRWHLVLAGLFAWGLDTGDFIVNGIEVEVEIASQPQLIGN